MGSSGGGGSSGAVSHSAYLESVHADWLNSTGADTITSSMTDVMDAAIGNSPWTGVNAYDPDADVAAYEVELAAFKLLLAGLSDTVDWAALYAQAALTLDGPAEAALLADATAYAAIIDDNINTVTLPRFRRGMQDINAVQSSAFVVGEAVIEGFRDRDVAKYLSSLRLSTQDKKMQATELMVQMMSRRIAWQEAFVRTVIEAKRIKMVAKKEQIDQDTAIDESDAKWDLEVFQAGANLMAASAGGTSSAGVKGISKLQSALGGAMSGAAAGAMIGSAVTSTAASSAASGVAAGAASGASAGSAGGYYGAAIGAVLGAAVALMSN